jgi:hypothetical protein
MRGAQPGRDRALTSVSRITGRARDALLARGGEYVENR